MHCEKPSKINSVKKIPKSWGKSLNAYSLCSSLSSIGLSKDSVVPSGLNHNYFWTAAGIIVLNFHDFLLFLIWKIDFGKLFWRILYLLSTFFHKFIWGWEGFCTNNDQILGFRIIFCDSTIYFYEIFGKKGDLADFEQKRIFWLNLLRKEQVSEKLKFGSGKTMLENLRICF